jgi:hypothetical protein
MSSEIDSVDKLIGELENIAPIPHDPGYVSQILLRNQNIWLLVKELKKLKEKAAKKNKLREVEPDEDEIEEIMPRRQRKS